MSRVWHIPLSLLGRRDDVADRQGFLIIDETPAVSLQFDTDENVAERLRMCLQQTEEMIVRDKNHPSVVMWSEEYQAALIGGYLDVAARKAFVAGLHIWNFANFAAVQSPGRVGGVNRKGVFTRTCTPKMAAHRLRAYWTRPRADGGNARSNGD